MTRPRVAPLAALGVVLAVAPLVVDYPTLEAQVLIFGLLAVAFNILMGQMGFLSFGQAAFSGIGAYTAALVLLHLHVPLLLALLLGVGAGAFAALVVGTLSIQGAGVYAVMLTFAFNQMAYYLAFELKDLTGGDNGLRNVPRPPVLGVPLDSARAYYYFVAVVFVLALYAVLRLVDSPFGRVLAAIRENEARARAVGFDVRRFKIVAFVVSGGLTGLGGALYGLLYQFVPLQAIDFNTSTNIVVMAILGGTGSMYGPIIGAAIFTLLSNTFSQLWARWPLLLGLLFCTVVLAFRGGVWGLVESVAARCRARRPLASR